MQHDRVPVRGLGREPVTDEPLTPLTDAELSALEHNIGRLRAGREAWDSPLPFDDLARTIALGPTPRLVAEVRRLRANSYRLAYHHSLHFPGRCLVCAEHDTLAQAMSRP